MTAETTTRAPGPPVTFEESRLAVQRTFRETMLRHRKLGESIAVWEDGQVVEVPPEEIGRDWDYIEGLPPELNPPATQLRARTIGTNGHARHDGFLRGLLVGSVLGAGLAAVALLVSRE